MGEKNRPAAGRGRRSAPRRDGRTWRLIALGTVTLAAAATVTLSAAPAFAGPSSWTGTASANQAASSNNLSGVSCASATSCMAVGSWVNGSDDNQTLAESWTGTSWKVLPTPDPGALSNQFNGVSCVSATHCVAVGGFSTSGGATDIVIAVWNGSTWTTQAGPDPSMATNDLNAVSCTSTSNCVAVGDYDNGDGIVPLVETWNGVTWALQSSPAKGSLASLASVSCTSASNCVAVGRWLDSGSFTLAERWNGSAWSIVTTPSPGGHNDDELDGVSCATASSCAAVGFFFNGSATETLAEVWNGSAWTHTTSPSPSVSDNALTGVSCPAAGRCFAVGSRKTGSVDQTLVESWNGSTWTTQPAPSPSGEQNGLRGVSCPATAACLTVGDDIPRGTVTPQTLAEFWDGSTWSYLASPDQGAALNLLGGVSCTGASSCMAVGYFENASSVLEPLTESWNGSVWTAVAAPSANTSDNTLFGVSCPAASDCMAVGRYTSGGLDQTLAERWNGSTWSVLTTPDPGTIGDSFNSVSCVSATDCMAVGFEESSSPDLKTLAAAATRRAGRPIWP